TTFFGSGSGTISSSVTQSNIPLPAKNFPSQTCWLDRGAGGDFEQADRVDMVMIGRCSAGAGTIYYGTSDKAGHYSVKEITESDRSVNHLPYTADVNGDGRLDVVLGAEDSTTGNMEFLINNGGGSFTLKQVFSVNTYAGGYLSEVFPGGAADFDQDGKWEAVVGFTQAPDCCKPPTPGIALLKPDASGNYVESQRWTAAAEPDAVVTADFNQDGKPDIATFQVNYNTGFTAIILYLNTGAPACAPPASPGVHLCSPLSDSTYNSPVKVEASGKAANGSVLRYGLWIDGKKYGDFAPATVDTMKASVPMSSGTHRVVVVEDDSVGGHLASPAVYIQVN
ncbi:MAG TPA: VCBS repeat-containing protein, partial [Candidatus Koribacter sp.]